MREDGGDDPPHLVIAGLIPARWGSTRFEGKHLVAIKGRSMIQRVHQRACMARCLDSVHVVTDSERIVEHCQALQIATILVADECESGTDRIARCLDLVHADVYVNVQGDEPLIDPRAIDKLVESFDPEIGVANACVQIRQTYKVSDPSVVKVVMDRAGNALYYSRLGIPFFRTDPPLRYQQLGLYAFTRERLRRFAEMPKGALERWESVEMLRFLEHGFRIKMVEVDDVGLSVDLPGDVKLVEDYLNSREDP